MSKIKDFTRKAPLFWQKSGSLSQLLEPLSFLYTKITTWRLFTVYSWCAPTLISCVGNLVIGGAGKTPVTLSITRFLQQYNVQSICLTRGYNGSLCGPLQVITQHTSKQVGDEALLLAEELPTVVASCRVEGAKLALSLGARAIIMDDGYQNANIRKDIALIVVDGHYGFGNGLCLPAGPLRESIIQGTSRATAIVLVGQDRCSIVQNTELPLIRTYSTCELQDNSLFRKKVVAFSGIGRPEKFFDTLKSIGAYLIACYQFSDHHLYTSSELSSMLNQATMLQAIPVTTAKDAARLPTYYKRNIKVLKTLLELDNTDILTCIFNSFWRNLSYANENFTYF